MPDTAAVRDTRTSEAPATDGSRNDGARFDAATEAGCPPPPDGGVGLVCVRRVEGRVVDLAGQPVAGRPVTTCGPVCVFSRSDAMGRFTATIDDWMDPRIYNVIAHGRPAYATLYFPLPTPGTDGVVTLRTDLVLAQYRDIGPVLPSMTTGGTATAGDITVTIPAGANIELDVEDATLGMLGQQLRVVEVPLDRAPPFVAGQGLTTVYALAPFAMLSSVPMPLRIANRGRLAAGTAVEFVVMGEELLVPPVTGGQPIVAATGTVSADGASIDTDPGQGLRFLTWVGFRPRR